MFQDINQIHFAKTRKVKSPLRAPGGNAGIDLFIPDEFSAEDADKIMTSSVGVHVDKSGYITILSGGRVLIPSGLKFKTPENTALIAHNKSGIAVKRGLDHGAEVVDACYQGEVHISLFNPSSETVILSPGEKIIQFLLIPVYHSELAEVKEDELFNEESDRGSGAFGSTGTT